MNAPIRNPHVDVDRGYWGDGGPAGVLKGTPHAADDAGLTHQCAVCELVTVYEWQLVDDYADHILNVMGDGEIDSIPLPPCPGCGALCYLNNSNVEYALERPHHYTIRIIREHILERPRLRGRFRINVIEDDRRFEGLDFSHKAKKDRPAHHQKLAAKHLGKKADRTPDHPDG
jgi:hypothetical protein